MPETQTLSPDTTMRELLELYPGAQRALFRKYHIGGCASCGFQPEETIGEVCARNENLPPVEVIAHIEQAHEEEEKIFVSPADAAESIAAGARLLDIRTREEFDAVHVPGAEFFTQELMQEALMKWDRKAAVILIDHRGTRSLDAAAYFTGHDFEDARAVRGGIDAWSQEIDASLPRYHLE